MPFTIVRDDLKNYETDAVAVSANERLVIDGGNGLSVASKIGLAEIQRACDAIGGCSSGNAVTVKTGNARNPLLIFAVGPVWRDGSHGEPSVLRDTVASILREASAHGAKSLALPLIATGAFGFPADLAFQITTRTIKAFLQTHDMDVTLVLYSRDAVRAAVDYGEIKRFIDDNYVDAHRSRRGNLPDRPRFDPMTGEPLYDEAPHNTGTYVVESSQTSTPIPASSQTSQTKQPKKKRGFLKRRRKKKELEEPKPEYREITPDALESASIRRGAAIPGSLVQEITVSPATWDEYQIQDEELDSWLARKHDSFTVTLFKMIDIRGLADSDVYKRANMSRQLFSKIRSDVNYHPKKKTVLALAIALELSLSETRELLDCAGFSLSQSSQFDLIIEYFIRKNVYDCFTINEALFAFGEELLS